MMRLFNNFRIMKKIMIKKIIDPNNPQIILTVKQFLRGVVAGVVR